MVMQKQSWVRYAKKSPKMREIALKYRSGRVILGTNEPKMTSNCSTEWLRSGVRHERKRCCCATFDFASIQMIKAQGVT